MFVFQVDTGVIFSCSQYCHRLLLIATHTRVDSKNIGSKVSLKDKWPAADNNKHDRTDFVINVTQWKDALTVIASWFLW